jgi:hypothetical protein
LPILQATHQNGIREELKRSDRQIRNLFSNLFKFLQRLAVSAQEFPCFDLTIRTASEQKVIALDSCYHHTFDLSIMRLLLCYHASRAEKHMNSMRVLNLLSKS